ncbi:MAG: hypothetical protein FWF10_11145 [Clostridiales bacterium]|nr:hypothetical protein [Clostridiales bacterium]
MLSFDETAHILDGLAAELPGEFFRHLNGGIVLLPQSKLHRASAEAQRLYILGEYHHEPIGLGRYIAIYYGSFCRVHGGETPERQVERLRETLRHEFTHHMESLAGERGLEIRDAIALQDYKEKYG